MSGWVRGTAGTLGSWALCVRRTLHTEHFLHRSTGFRRSSQSGLQHTLHGPRFNSRLKPAHGSGFAKGTVLLGDTGFAPAENDIAGLFQSERNAFDKITNAWQRHLCYVRERRGGGKPCMNSKTIQLYLISATYCCLSLCVCFTDKIKQIESAHT